MNRGFLIILLFLCFSAPAQDTVIHYRIHAQLIDDDYDVRIRRPRQWGAGASYSVLLAMDGNIGSGKYLIESASRPDSVIIVTIGHTGNWHQKRNRDFIPAEIRKDDRFQADRFLAFLKEEFLPDLERRLPGTKERVLTGHSLGGLFCLYAALKRPEMFDRYEAISPSVWANGLELLKIEKMRRADLEHTALPIRIHLGALEIFNRVISSTRKFQEQTGNGGYRCLALSIRKYPMRNHFSVRKPALRTIIRQMK